MEEITDTEVILLKEIMNLYNNETNKDISSIPYLMEAAPILEKRN
jgi:hypothetical protein